MLTGLNLDETVRLHLPPGWRADPHPVSGALVLTRVVAEEANP